MLMRLGKFILFLFLICLIVLIIYWGILKIFGDKSSYDGTFVFEERVKITYGNLY